MTAHDPRAVTRPTTRSACLFAGACFVASACAPAQRTHDWVPGRSDTVAPDPSANVVRGRDSADEANAELEAVLERVSRVRQLPIRRAVRSRALSRDELRAKLVQKMNEEIPPGVIALQGESLRALELVPLDYDFEAGLLQLLQGRIAGLYDPDDQTMYLLDDLGDSLKEETLNHELVHALQDQSFDLAPLLKFKAGKGDMTTAIQTLVEGDATSAMFEVAGGSSLDIDEGALRALFLVSTRFSADGVTTPSILQSSLISPYTDGFSFVQALRRRGGWPEVDGAFRRLPDTTEQALHLDKFVSREPAIPIADPTLTALGPGFESAFVDSIGELGLREMLEEWEARKIAKVAAAGWGGDRYVVAQRKTADGGAELAVAYHVRMDTVGDASEVAAIFTTALGSLPKGAGASARGGNVFCKERAMLGPIAWTARDADLALVAGPYSKGPAGFRSVGTCATARAWLAETLGEAPRKATTPSRP